MSSEDGADREAIEREREALRAERGALEEQARRLAEEREALRREREELAEERERLDEERRRAAEAGRARVDKEADALAQAVKKAREELRAAQQSLRAAELDARALREAERRIADVARQVSIGGALEPGRRGEPERAGVGAVTVGMKVFVPRLRTEAQVVEVLGGGQVRVAAGPLKLLTSLEELRATVGKGGTPTPPPAAKRAERARKSPGIAFDPAADPDLPVSTPDNTVDLRGLRAHEAVAMAEQFLDRCLGQGLRVAFLIHGHGTGALRKEVREAVRLSPYVERSRPGEAGEGGDGVTVVWLR